MFRFTSLALLLSTFAPAATVTGINLTLGSYSGSGSSLTTPSLASAGNGWIYSGSVLVNQTIGNTASNPIEVRLTSLEAICDITFCGTGFIDFSAVLTFSETFVGFTPYTVSIQGSGPAGNATWGIGGQFDSHAFEPTGNFSFSSSGNATLASGNQLTISGFFGIAPANQGTTLFLPNSFDITASPVFAVAVPEPATADLAGLALALGALALRRRR